MTKRASMKRELTEMELKSLHMYELDLDKLKKKDVRKLRKLQSVKGRGD